MDLISLLIYVIIVGCIFGLIYWLIGVIGLPEPFRKVAIVILAVIGVLMLLGALTGHVSMPVFRPLR